MKKLSIITIISLAGIAFLIYIIYQDRRKKTEAKKTKENSTPTNDLTTNAVLVGNTTNPASSETDTDTNNEFTEIQKAKVLKQGSTGEEVKALQIYLNVKKPYLAQDLVIDGVFGNLTRIALERRTNRSETTLKALEIDAKNVSNTHVFKKTWLGYTFILPD
jgi:peptidoglycan hydrolase-like protein with peptidoglycan-binding domain